MLASLVSLIAAGAALVASQQTGNHPEWDRWCGKVYQAGCVPVHSLQRGQADQSH